MQRHSQRQAGGHRAAHGRPWPLRGEPGPRRIRLFALAALAAAVGALPLAVASAGPVGDEERAAVRGFDRIDRVDDEPPAPSRSPLRLGLGLATAARCGPELSSPDGVEAQTCVLTQGQETWARTYYRNATGEALDAALSIMGPDGRTVQTHCAVGATDDPGVCETPRGRVAGAQGAHTGAYTAVAEFARSAGRGPLLLRSGSESGRP